jgi:hypothetical protein
VRPHRASEGSAVAVPVAITWVGRAASEVLSRDPSWVAVSPREAVVLGRVMARPHRAGEGCAAAVPAGITWVGRAASEVLSRDPSWVAVSPREAVVLGRSARREQVGLMRHREQGAQSRPELVAVSPDLEGMAFCRDPQVWSCSHRGERGVFCRDPRWVALSPARAKVLPGHIRKPAPSRCPHAPRERSLVPGLTLDACRRASEGSAVAVPMGITWVGRARERSAQSRPKLGRGLTTRGRGLC